jgi:hypothetical protein
MEQLPNVRNNLQNLRREDHRFFFRKNNYKLICFIQIYVVSLYSNNNTMNTLHFRDFCEMVVRGNKRTDQVEQGAYDGRFKPRVIEDKKKKQSKFLCRIKIKTY